MVQFVKATKSQARARIALVGPSGSGKTYSALAIGAGLGTRVAVIDTEHGTAAKYAGDFNFDTLALDSYAPERYMEAILAAEAAGYDVLIIDSLSHAWAGKDGLLEFVDNAAKRGAGGGNNFSAWRDATPLHNRLVDTILAARLHVIVTMRTKTEWVMEADARGKMIPRKVGTAPVQRAGIEYEFDLVGDLTQEHDLLVTKTRCPALDNGVYNKPGADLAKVIRDWLTDGTPIVDAPRPIGQEGSDSIQALTISAADAHGLDRKTLGQQVMALCRDAGRNHLRDLTDDEAQPILDALEHVQETGAWPEVLS